MLWFASIVAICCYFTLWLVIGCPRGPGCLLIHFSGLLAILIGCMKPLCTSTLFGNQAFRLLCFRVFMGKEPFCPHFTSSGRCCFHFLGPQHLHNYDLVQPLALAYPLYAVGDSTCFFYGLGHTMGRHLNSIDE